jgi:hypothetical protein
LVDGKDGIDDVGRELFGERAVEFCREGRPRNREEELSVDLLLELELVEELTAVSVFAPCPLPARPTFSASVFAMS